MTRKQFLRLTGLGCMGWPLARAAEARLPAAKPALEYITPDQPSFNLLRQGFNKAISRKPAVIALCRSTEDVARAIARAREDKLKVAIKSGGHCFEGFSSIDDGMVVNLSKMNRIEWLDGTRVRIESGCMLSRIHDTLLARKRLLPAGSCGTVGIGGLTLGGGYGLFSRRYGLTCDHLTDLTMVDGRGNILKASGDDEILWACRGGGNGNFGVVTDMTFSTRSAPATLQSHRFKTHQLTTAKARHILERWFELMKALPETCFSAFVLNGRSLLILITNHGPHTPGLESILKALKAMTDKQSSGSAIPLARAIKVFYGRTEPCYFRNSSAGYYRDFQTIAPFVDEILDITFSHGFIYQINTLGGQIQQDDLARKSSYPHRAYPFLSEIQSYWEKPSQAEHFAAKFAEIQTILIRNKITAQYVNYPSLLFENCHQAYFGDHYERLQMMKAKLDPDDLFARPQGVKAKV